MTKCLWDDFTESMHLAANMEGRIGLYLCNRTSHVLAYNDIMYMYMYMYNIIDI